MKKYTTPELALLAVFSADVITASASPVDYVFSSAPGFGDIADFDWS